VTYCIYTNKITSDPSPEHIFPLSLGGHNKFTIQVDQKFNNDIGSKVDGKLANDFAVLFERDRADAVGYSGKQPHPIVKKANLTDGTPIQATFGKDGLKLFDLINKKEVSNSDARGRVIHCNDIKIDMDIDLIFVAKVALAAGYFAYGDVFKEHVETEDLRNIMNFDKKNLPEKSSARVYGRFYKPEPTEDMFHILKMATELGNCSSVVMMPSEESFGVAVSVLGTFMGFVSVPSCSKYLPNTDNYKYGHCIYLQGGEVKRFSFEHIRKKLLEALK
jgi:hypothetical protein